MDQRREPMTSQRKKTAPPTPRPLRSSSSSRKGLIATEKTKKQSAKKRTSLRNPFHRPPVAEPRAAPQRRPHRGTVAAATDECLGRSDVRPPCRRAVDFSCARN